MLRCPSSVVVRRPSSVVRCSPLAVIIKVELLRGWAIVGKNKGVACIAEIYMSAKGKEASFDATILTMAFSREIPANYGQEHNPTHSMYVQTDA